MSGTANNFVDICRSQAARAQRKAETYRRRMAALGQPVVVAEPSPVYAPAFQQPYQGMYLDPYAAQGYGAPQYTPVPVYPNYPERAFPADVPVAGALQWEMPQVRQMCKVICANKMYILESGHALHYPLWLFARVCCTCDGLELQPSLRQHHTTTSLSVCIPYLQCLHTKPQMAQGTHPTAGSKPGEHAMCSLCLHTCRRSAPRGTDTNVWLHLPADTTTARMSRTKSMPLYSRCLLKLHLISVHRTGLVTGPCQIMLQYCACLYDYRTCLYALLCLPMRHTTPVGAKLSL